jgi:glycine/D-amino acid oxidase-like deaminating enzyme
VVGSGIVGVCVAYNLVNRGCKVLLIEKEERSCRGATLKSWAWINANGKQPQSYQSLNMLAMKVWRECFSEHVDWCGTVLASHSTPSQPDPGYSIKVVRDCDLISLEPQLNRAGLDILGEMVLHHFPDEGLTEPEKFVEHLLQLAEKAGVRTIYGTEVESILAVDAADGATGAGSESVCGLGGRSAVRLRDSRTGRISAMRADVVVLANGTGVERLAATGGWSVPMVDRPGRLVRTAPLAAPRLRKIIVTPQVHLLQRPDGRVVIGESAERGGASSAAYAVAAAAAGDKGPAPAPMDDGGDAAYGRELLGRAAGLVPALAGATVEEVTLGHRPMPADGLPVIGFLENPAGGR